MRLTLKLTLQLDLEIDNLPDLPGPFLCTFNAFGRVLETEASRTQTGVICPTPRTDSLPAIPPQERKSSSLFGLVCPTFDWGWASDQKSNKSVFEPAAVTINRYYKRMTSLETGLCYFRHSSWYFFYHYQLLSIYHYLKKKKRHPMLTRPTLHRD